MLFISSNKYPEVGLLGHMTVLFLIFWGTSILFPIEAAPFYNPTSSARGLSFLRILIKTCFWWFVDDGHSDRCEAVSHCGLICISLMISKEHLFIRLFAICLSPLEKCLFRPSAHLKSNCLLFWVLSCMSSLYILDINPLSDVSLGNIFSHSVSCLFILMMICFPVQNFVV